MVPRSPEPHWRALSPFSSRPFFPSRKEGWSERRCGGSPQSRAPLEGRTHRFPAVPSSLRAKKGVVSGGVAVPRSPEPHWRAALRRFRFGSLVTAARQGEGEEYRHTAARPHPSGNVRRRSSRSPLIARMRSDSSCTEKSVASSSTPLRFSFFFAPAIVYPSS